MKLTLSILTVLAIASSSFSFMPSKADAVTITGDYTCDVWSKYRNTANLRMRADSYLFGLMNGLAVATDNNPLENVLYGAYKLMAERHGPEWYK